MFDEKLFFLGFFKMDFFINLKGIFVAKAVILTEKRSQKTEKIEIRKEKEKKGTRESEKRNSNERKEKRKIKKRKRNRK